MGTCKYCGESKRTISVMIGFCADCIRDHFDAVWPEIKKVHDRSRKAYGFPTDPPRSENGESTSGDRLALFLPIEDRIYFAGASTSQAL